MASTITLSSPPAAILSVVKGPTKGLDDVSPRKVPYGGDIHKLRDDFDPELETKCRFEDARIRGFPAWSSPIADPTTTQVQFKYRANGHYLKFLSLFLTGERQVDISFSQRHALTVFLLNSLEECHSQYARRRIPEEFEKLQMISSDELELQVWQAFIRADHLKLGVMDYATDEHGKTYLFFESVNRIRQLAVHRSSTYRWNFDTRIIKSAAACAQHLGDEALLETIELLVKVLYADAGGESEYAVTDDERSRAYNLLWPSNRQPETTHQLLDKLQNLAEKSSYSFCRKRLPQELVGFECTTAEHFELSQWRKVIMYRCHCTEDEDSFAELDMKLQKADVSMLRNAASHRESLILYSADKFYDDSPVLRTYIKTAKAYVRALGDEETALEIETLEHEVLPALSKKYNDDWLNPQWCYNRDLEVIGQKLRQRRSQWESLRDHFWDTREVNINPILPVYSGAETRLYLLRRKLGLNDITPEPSEDNVGQTPCESAVESLMDLNGWPSLADLDPSGYSKPTETLSDADDSSPFTSSTNSHDDDRREFPFPVADSLEQEQEGFDTTTGSDRGSDVSEGYTASWGEGNESDTAVGSAADRGIAVGYWDDADGDTTSSDAEGTNEDTDDEDTVGKDTDNTEDSEWWSPDPAADRGIAVGNCNGEHDETKLAEADDTDEDTDEGTDTDGDTDDTEYTDETEQAEWLCPDSAADRGIALGGWNDAYNDMTLPESEDTN
ncbi:MAG: hypothetical protein L6R38_005873 [Xanthoria sp. 2 TBL-2021]|nr:MAG: hypothetical protein L6R38_005873 [Xanthoria sp. 2 TBL-2021]